MRNGVRPWTACLVFALAACSSDDLIFFASPPLSSDEASIVFAIEEGPTTRFYAADVGDRLSVPAESSTAEVFLFAATLPRPLAEYDLGSGPVPLTNRGRPLSEEALRYLAGRSENAAEGWTELADVPPALAGFELSEHSNCPRFEIGHEEFLGQFATLVTPLADGRALLSGSSRAMHVVSAGRPAGTLQMPEPVTGAIEVQAGEVLVVGAEERAFRLDLETETATLAFNFGLPSNSGYGRLSSAGAGGTIEVFGIDQEGTFAQLRASGSRTLSQLGRLDRSSGHCDTVALSPNEALAVCVFDARVHRFRDEEASTEVPEGLPASSDGFVSLLTTQHSDGSRSWTVVSDDGFLFRQTESRRWELLGEPSGVSVDAALALGDGFILGAKGGQLKYFQPERATKCPPMGMTTISEFLDIEAHEDGFLVVGRSRRGASAWAFVRLIAPS